MAESSSRDGGERPNGLGAEQDHEPTRVDLSASSGSDQAESARDDAGPWVLLEPPNPVMTFWWRAAAVTLLALTLVLLLDLPGVAGPRSSGQWTLLSLAALSVVVGGVWLWVAAALPRPIDREIARLAPARVRRERRRLSRALRSGEPLARGDRPAAAADTARRYDDLRSPSIQLTLTGFLVTLSAGTTLSIGNWVLPAVLGALCLHTILAAHRARALQRAAAHVGVAPLVSDTPQPLGDIGPTAAGRPRTRPRH